MMVILRAQKLCLLRACHGLLHYSPTFLRACLHILRMLLFCFPQYMPTAKPTAMPYNSLCIQFTSSGMVT